MTFTIGKAVALSSAPRPTPRSVVPAAPKTGTMSDNPAVAALTRALRDNASDLTEQDKAVREAEATLKAANLQMETLRCQREGLQAALQALRSVPVTSPPPT